MCESPKSDPIFGEFGDFDAEAYFDGVFEGTGPGEFSEEVFAEKGADKDGEAYFEAGA